jgi:hypothetical protein
MRMGRVFYPRKSHDLARASVFLIVVALISGTVGCGPIQYSLTISSTEGGEVAHPGEGTFAYNEGTVVNLMAEADEGYQFVAWTGDVGAIADVRAASTTITVNGRYSITASFAIALEIHDWYDLDAIRHNLAGNYTLMNDLDSTTAGYGELARPAANGGKGWQPIGSYDAAFTGSFDGQGYEIRGLFINRPDEDDVGLFGDVEQSGVIKNVGVAEATVVGQDHVGGLLGVNWEEGTVSNSYYTGNVTGSSHHYHVGGLLGGNEGTVSNSYSTGNVTGGGYVGGLVGTNTGTVRNAHSGSTVTANDELVGGLAGMNVGTVSNSSCTGNVTGNLGVGGLAGGNGAAGSPGTVTNCYATGSVSGETYVGGLIGGNSYEGSIVSNSFATGSVTGESSVGGLVGANQRSTVADCYCIGHVTGIDNVGGLLGENLIDGNVSNSYSTGSVTGESFVGGLVGSNEEGSVSNSFWDLETSGQATSAGGTGMNTTQMQDIAAFSGAGWDIIAVALNETNPAYIWNIVNGATYPFLSWQAVE